MLQFIYKAAGVVEVGFFLTLCGMGYQYFSAPQEKKKSQNSQEVQGSTEIAFARRYPAIFILVAVAMVGVYLWMQQYAKVPNLVNLSKRDAITALYAADLEVSFPAGVAEDEIVTDQDPAKGEIVEKGCMITLKFAKDSMASDKTENSGSSDANGDSSIPSDPISFGVYKQDGPDLEDIQWRVLAIQDGNALLLSDRALEAMSFNGTYGQTSWKNSSARSWLNDEFLNTAFTEQEQEIIVETQTEKGCNDHVFLLSYTEATRYLRSEDSRICEPTNHVASQEADAPTTRETKNGTAVWWWLRSMAEDNSQAYFVNFEGKIYTNMVGNNYLSLRPAIWVDWNKYKALH